MSLGDCAAHATLAADAATGAAAAAGGILASPTASLWAGRDATAFCKLKKSVNILRL